MSDNLPPSKRRRRPLLRLLDFLRPLKRLLIALGSALLGALVVLIIAGVVHLNGRPDLESWHTIELTNEFSKHSPVSDFSGYLQLESRLFEELDEKIYSNKSSTAPINRYRSGSPADPRKQPINGNRTFELIADNGAATCSILLLHGMSDSPYSLRQLGETLHAQGAHVIGLRLPGHGTLPSGLVRVDWRDMHAAVCLAVEHFRKSDGDVPLFLIGYSNGSALAVHYSLESFRNDQLTQPSGIVLISPAIGVSPMARLAVWQGRLGRWAGLEKLAWSSIQPEYDPYKYNSFAVNAGHQVHRLTVHIDRDLQRLAKSDSLQSFPPVIAFQSVIDATVSTTALIENLFARLPARPDGQPHELVLFDINRDELINSLIDGDPTVQVANLLHRSDQHFAITLFSNLNAPQAPPTVTTWQNGVMVGPAQAPEIAWPTGLYSLSHISLPFSPDDTLYGNLPPYVGTDGTHYRIGNVVLRGERGVLQIPASDQLRLRWNPFYSWMENRIVEFVAPAAASGPPL